MTATPDGAETDPGQPKAPYSRGTRSWGPTRGRLLLLFLGLSGNLGELEFCLSGRRSPTSDGMSLVVVGHCRAASDDPPSPGPGPRSTGGGHSRRGPSEPQPTAISQDGESAD